MKIVEEIIENYFDNNELNIEKTIYDYKNYIFTIISHSYVNLSYEDTEEVVLDVFLTIWKNQDKLDVNKKMSSYIAGVTKNLIRYKYRQNKINQNIDEYEDKLIDLSNFELVLLQSEQSKIIFNQLNSEKKEDRDIFNCYYFSNKSIKEIAKQYKISESKVKSKLYRIRKRLNKALMKGGYHLNEK